MLFVHQTILFMNTIASFWCILLFSADWLQAIDSTNKLRIANHNNSATNTNQRINTRLTINLSISIS